MTYRACIITGLTALWFFSFAQPSVTADQVRKEIISKEIPLVGALAELNEFSMSYEEALQLLGLSRAEELFLGFNFTNCFYAEVYLDGTAEEIGLSKEAFMNALKLRLRNSVEGLPACEQFPDQRRPVRVGFTIWTIGTDYPVAYHLEMNTYSDHGPYREPFNDQTLGFGTAADIENEARNTLDKQVENLGIAYLKGIGQW